MWKLLRRQWRYLTAKLGGRLEEAADPKVQLEQAMADAQEQHRRLVAQAANVVANQKQTELQLNRSLAELEKLNGSARQALQMAAEAAGRGEADKAAEYNATAEAFANRMIAVEHQAQDLKSMHLQGVEAAEQAKKAVQQSSAQLQRRLAERQKLLSQLDQARMQEQMNRAMSTLSETVDQDVPSFDEVRDKIEARYARALGTAEVTGRTVESRMLEVEQAAAASEARRRLEQMRGELGLAAPPGPGTTTGAPGVAPPASTPVAGTPDQSLPPGPPEGEAAGGEQAPPAGAGR